MSEAKPLNYSGPYPIGLTLFYVNIRSKFKESVLCTNLTQTASLGAKTHPEAMTSRVVVPGVS